MLISELCLFFDSCTGNQTLKYGMNLNDFGTYFVIAYTAYISNLAILVITSWQFIFFIQVFNAIC